MTITPSCLPCNGRGVKSGPATPVMLCGDIEFSGSIDVDPNSVRSISVQPLCDDNGTFYRVFIYNGDGTQASVSNIDLAGAVYVPVGVVGECNAETTTGYMQMQCYCDDVAGDGTGLIVPFKRLLLFPSDGLPPTTVGDYTEDFSANYVVVGTARLCEDIGTPTVPQTGAVSLTGATSWSMPATAFRIKITVVAGTPSITLDSGTVVLFSGAVLEFVGCGDCCSQIGTVELTLDVGHQVFVVYEYMG